MKDLLLKNAAIFTRTGFRKQDVLIKGDKVLLSFSKNEEEAAAVQDMDGFFIIPGFADVHVHLREPGFSYKETIRTGTEAAAHGGYTAVCAMPNLKPAPATVENLLQEVELIQKDALVRVYPYGSITQDQSGRGALSDMEALAPYVCAFSDDGKGVQESWTMLEAMMKAKDLDRIIVAHCEDENELVPGGCIHDGEYARMHGHIGINSASEWKQVERDIELAKNSRGRYHICHVSTKESVALIRKAKAEGVRVTAETGPHYLMFTDMDLEEDGRWRMNPPIRSKEDRAALIKGIQDGTIDCIITDHAPHSQEEKAGGLDHSAFGIVGLESCFPAMYHNLVLRHPEKIQDAEERKARGLSLRVDETPVRAGRKPVGKDPLDPEGLVPESHGAISLEKLIELMAVKPREIFNLPGPRYIEDGVIADLAVLDLKPIYRVQAEDFYSMGKSTLFTGQEVQGAVVKTFVNGKLVYDRETGIVRD